ncbi:nucleotidyltransferase [Candidatus Woesearchaeota archaeon CG_4_10_14_0_2_um_filter_57_5]|nr:MAG: hypothetical protein AUJ68_06040 [Candidatus Woesearchaeota archaeon CG1_02_57_44]PIZ55666.1 MAG: nucleotidyltransferase [Candidatus Woesearchaeota archaeon CG_4_10_14_0_2_um_filter_57_5]
MATIIPMAGLGSRFARDGYVLPKPLVPVSGKPMILRVIEDLPKDDKWVFMVRKEHVDDYAIDKVLRSALPDAIIVPVEKTTEGQACTCMLAAPYLEPGEPLLIAACDNGYLYDTVAMAGLMADSSVDAILWTFTKKETLRRNPRAWGWVVPGEDGRTVKDVSVKVPVSDNPYNDHAVVATFWFRRAGDFMAAVDAMIKADHRINNEFYVDAVPKFLNTMHKRTVFFDIDLYLGWGTPKDLYDHQRMEFLAFYGDSAPLSAPLSAEETRDLGKYRQYFAAKGL